MSSIRRLDANGRRTYVIPDVGDLVSVTTFLQAVPKPFLVGWAARKERELVIEAAVRLGTVTRATLTAALPQSHAHEIELDIAGELGSEAHALIEWWLRGSIGPQPEAREGAQIAFRAAKRWCESVELEPIFCEQEVWSATREFAGTMDVFARLMYRGERRLGLVDWKTSKRYYPEHGLQNAAYITALAEMGHCREDEVLGVIVQLPKGTDGKTDGSTDGDAHVTYLEPPHAERLRWFGVAQEMWRFTRQVEGAYVRPAELPIDKPEQITATNAFSFTERA